MAQVTPNLPFPVPPYQATEEIFGGWEVGAAGWWESVFLKPRRGMLPLPPALEKGRGECAPPLCQSLLKVGGAC